MNSRTLFPLALAFGITALALSPPPQAGAATIVTGGDPVAGTLSISFTETFTAIVDGFPSGIDFNTSLPGIDSNSDSFEFTGTQMSVSVNGTPIATGLQVYNDFTQSGFSIPFFLVGSIPQLQIGDTVTFSGTASGGITITGTPEGMTVLPSGTYDLTLVDEIGAVVAVPVPEPGAMSLAAAVVALSLMVRRRP